MFEVSIKLPDILFMPHILIYKLIINVRLLIIILSMLLSRSKYSLQALPFLANFANP